MRRIAGESVRERRKPTDGGETTKSQGKVAVKDSAREPKRVPSAGPPLLIMQADTFNEDAVGCLGQNALLLGILRDV